MDWPLGGRQSPGVFLNGLSRETWVNVHTAPLCFSPSVMYSECSRRFISTHITWRLVIHSDRAGEEWVVCSWVSGGSVTDLHLFQLPESKYKVNNVLVNGGDSFHKQTEESRAHNTTSVPFRRPWSSFRISQSAVLFLSTFKQPRTFPQQLEGSVLLLFIVHCIYCVTAPQYTSQIQSEGFLSISFTGLKIAPA